MDPIKYDGALIKSNKNPTKPILNQLRGNSECFDSPLINGNIIPLDIIDRRNIKVDEMVKEYKKDWSKIFTGDEKISFGKLK